MTRYGPLSIDVDNQYTRGQDGYPHTLTAAYDMLVNYHNPQVTIQMQMQDGGVALAQEEGDENPMHTPGSTGCGRGCGGRCGSGCGSSGQGKGWRSPTQGVKMMCT